MKFKFVFGSLALFTAVACQPRSFHTASQAASMASVAACPLPEPYREMSNFSGSFLEKRTKAMLDYCAESVVTLPGGNLSKNTSGDARFQALATFSLQSLVLPPGETYAEEGVGGSPVGGDTLRSRILLNVVMEEGEVSAKSIDIWSGSAALLKSLQEGRKTLGDLDKSQVEILVRGYPVPSKGGNKYNHWVRAAGVDFSALVGEYQKPIVQDGNHLLIEVAPHLTNFRLGSRMTLGSLVRNATQEWPKVGLQYGTFDPPHMGHLAPINAALKGQNGGSPFVQEVVIAPMPAPHKPNASKIAMRVEMTQLTFSGMKGMLVYQGTRNAQWEPHGNSILDQTYVDLVRAVYGTPHVYQITGQDVWDDAYSNNPQKFLAPRSPKLVVVKRGSDPMKPVPDSLRERVFLVTNLEGGTGLSSTKIRNALKSGSPVDPKTMEAKTVEYIRQNGLYGAQPEVKVLVPEVEGADE